MTDDEKLDTQIIIILPVYNTPSFYLNECIDSLLSQSHKNWHILVANDGSTSNETLEILQEFKLQNSKKCTFLSFAHRGITATLNDAIEYALNSNAQFIARMDADDICLPKRLENQLDFMLLNPHIDVCGTAVEMFSQKCKRIIQLPTLSEMIAWDMMFYCAMAHPSVMCRRRVFEKYIYPTHIICCEDYGLWLQMLKDGIQFANLPSIQLRLRKHSSAISQMHRQIQTDASLNLQTEFIKEFLTMKNALSPTADDSGFKFDSIVVGVMIKPDACEDIKILQNAFTLLERLEETFCKVNNHYSAENLDQVSGNANKRLGEIVLRQMRLQTQPSSATLHQWQRWIKRNPVNLLKNLLFDKNK